MNQPEFATNQNIEGKDDLRKIKGIGEFIARVLNELGIHRYSDLSKYTADQLTELLRENVPPIAFHRAKPEEWIQKAHTLAGITKAEITHSNSPESSATKDEQATAEEVAKPHRLNWREIADFFISFGYDMDDSGEEHLKTRAHHSQADQPYEWDGIASEEMLQWMHEQAKLPMVLKPQDLSIETEEEIVQEPEKEGDIHLALSNLWVSEVKVPIPSNNLRQTALLRLKSDLILSGPASNSFTEEQREYAIDVYLINTETKQSDLVGMEIDRLEPGNFLYEIQQDFSVPPVGNYQLYLVARLLPPSDYVTHLQGPVIRVDSD